MPNASTFILWSITQNRKNVASSHSNATWFPPQGPLLSRRKDMTRSSRASSSYTPTSGQARRQTWSKHRLTFGCNPDHQLTYNSIVFVSGLGANPLLSFKSTDTNFNWAGDEDGIARDFQNARILLYHSESSWNGPIKVKQFLHNLAHTLLEGLAVKREVHLPPGIDTM